MIYLVLACILYTAAVLLSTAASRNANTNLVSAITNLMSIIVPLVLVVPGFSKKTITEHQFGAWMAVLAGISIGFFVLALNKAFSENKLGIVTPVVYGGTILLSTVLSYFIFKEKVSTLEGLGLAFVLVGLVFVAYARASAG